MIKTKYILICLVCFLSACSQPKKHKQFEEQFTMHITTEGTKQFQLSVQMPSKKNKGHGGKGRGKGGGNLGGKRGREKPSMGNYDVVKPNAISNRLDERVEFHLATTSYCRDGYIETDSFNRSGQSILEGRCNDKATSEDRQKFR